jgi:hypothetical protein
MFAMWLLNCPIYRGLDHYIESGDPEAYDVMTQFREFKVSAYLDKINAINEFQKKNLLTNKNTEI